MIINGASFASTTVIPLKALGLHGKHLTRISPKFLEEILASAIFNIKGETLEAAEGMACACHESRFEFDNVSIREKGRGLMSHSYNSSALRSVAVDATQSQLPRLREITVPTIIVHGSEDPLIPTDHAEALKNAICKSTLLTMEGWSTKYLTNFYGIFQAHYSKT